VNLPTPQPPEARALGAWIIGVGLHPICLAVYEHFHFRGSRSVATLLRLGCAVLVVAQLGKLTLGSLPWWAILTIHSAITAWWVRLVYKVADSSGCRALHPRGAAAALVAGIPLAALQWLA
jgi:hypothetical protein